MFNMQRLACIPLFFSTAVMNSDFFMDRNNGKFTTTKTKAGIFSALCAELGGHYRHCVQTVHLYLHFRKLLPAAEPWGGNGGNRVWSWSRSWSQLICSR